MTSTTHNKTAFITRKSVLTLFIVITVIFSAFLIYLDNTIRNTFDGNKWSIPSTVYARSLDLYSGAPLTLTDLKTELTLLGYQTVDHVQQPGHVSFTADSADLYLLPFQFPDEQQAAQRIQLQFNDQTLVQLDSDDGASLLRLPPVVIGGIYPAHNEDRLLVQLNDVPATLQAMLVAVEDNQFYHHHGISPRGIARAIVANIKGGGLSQGASTLTQQLVKNYYLTADKTLSRKAQEALMSILLELHFTKAQILEGYINEIYLGQDGPRAIHGFGLASQYYFRKPLQDLSVQQQALLVTLVRGASYYNPWRHPERVLARRNLVLDIAVREGQLTAEVANLAKQQPLGLGDKTHVSKKRYPAYLDLVRRQLQRDYAPQDLANNGLSIFTHFDPLIQHSAESSLQNMVEQQKDNQQGAGLQGAMVVTRPNTGAVLAILGGSDARYAGFNRAIDAKRQVGSLIKPAVYLTALTQTTDYHLATPLSDAPYQLTQQHDAPWSPQNYDKQFHGDVLLYKALARSYNVSTARLGNDIGLGNIINTIHQLGIEQDIAPLPSLTLGAMAMSPFEMAQMYQTLSAEGFYTPLLAISTVVDSNGALLSHYPLAIEQRFQTANIYLLRHALQAATHEGTAKALQWLLPDFAVAGKTGTTNNLRDSWFAGFSGDMMSVVWLGKDDNSSTGLTGSSGALRVWADLFKQRAKLPIQNIPPQDIEIAWVDKDTGVGSQQSCENAIALPFNKGTAPVIEQRCNTGAKRVMDWFRDILQ